MALDPLDAYEAVMGFAARRGEAVLRLAMHAAVPQVLRVELLHLLRLNFVPEAADDSSERTLVVPTAMTLPPANFVAAISDTAAAVTSHHSEWIACFVGSST